MRGSQKKQTFLLPPDVKSWERALSRIVYCVVDETTGGKNHLEEKRYVVLVEKKEAPAQLLLSILHQAIAIEYCGETLLTIFVSNPIN